MYIYVYIYIYIYREREREIWPHATLGSAVRPRSIAFSRPATGYGTG